MLVAHATPIVMGFESRWQFIIGVIAIACADAPMSAEKVGLGQGSAGARDAGAERHADGQYGSIGGNAGNAGTGGAGGHGGGSTHKCPWVRLVTTGEPPSPRTLAPVVYDALRRRMLILGGRLIDGSGGHDADDLWGLSLSGEPTWTRLDPKLPAPTPHDQLPYRGQAVVDGQHLVVVQNPIVSGTTPAVWLLDLADPAEWRAVPFEDRRTRRDGYGHQLLLDAPGRRVIVYHGFRTDPWHGATPSDESYQLLLSDKAVFADLGASTRGPEFWSAHPVYDAVGWRILVYGESTRPPATSSPPVVWELSLSDPPTWTEGVAPGAPRTAAQLGDALYDIVGRRMLVLAPSKLDFNGNFGGTGQGGNTLDGGEDLTARVFAVSTGARERNWVELETTSGPRWLGQPVVYDEGNDRVLLFGGTEGRFGSVVGNDVWSLELAACR